MVNNNIILVFEVVEILFKMKFLMLILGIILLVLGGGFVILVVIVIKVKIRGIIIKDVNGDNFFFMIIYIKMIIIL